MAQINNYSRSGNTTLITYNPRYPGFDEEDYKKLETAAINRGLTGQAKTQFMDEAYQHYYPQVLNSHKLDERQVEINKNVAETGNAILNGNKTAEWNMKLVDLAQTAKRVKGIAYDYPDDQLIDTMKSNIPNGDKLLLNYLNDGDKELLYQAGLLETDAQQKAKAYNQKRQKINNALLNNWRELSDDGLKYVRDYNVMFQVVDEARQQGMGEGMNDNELLLNLIYASPELQQIEKEMGTLNLSDGDRRILGESEKRYDKNWNQISNDFRNFIGWNSNTPATHEDLQEEIYVRENGGAKENAKNFKANLRNFGDSVEKFLYRAPKDFENWVYKNLPSKGILQAEMGKEITDEEYKNIIEDRLLNNKLSVKDYNESLDKEIQAYRDKIGLDPVIENYFNKHGIVESVVNGTGPRYKMAGETAGNWDMLLGMGASIINPGIGLMVMGTDTFARENQESFDSLINAQTKQGVSYEDAYDNASKGALVVGAINTAIELGLEKFLGGVETTTASNIKKMITKDLNKEVTDMVAKRGIIDLLRRGLTTQARTSMEEGLEEIFQQLTQNIAVSQYDPDKKISEGLWEAFEGGALNPMNLLAGTTEIISAPTLSESDRQTFVNWANTLDVGGTQVTDGFNPKTIVNNIKNGGLYSMAPTISNLQDTENMGSQNILNQINNNQVTETQTTETTNNGQEKATLIEDLYSIDPTLKKNLQNNPYTAEVWQKTKDYIDKNGRPERSNDVAKNLIVDVADRVQEKLMEKMDEGMEAGKLYAPLKDGNYTVDLSELRNNIDSLLEEYGIKIEEYEGKDGKTKYDLNFDKTAIDGSEAANIRKIYNWIKDTDAPMGIKEYKDRFRATLSDMVDFNPNGRDQAGRKVADTQGDKVLKGIRNEANELAHNQIPVLADLDKVYNEWVKVMDEVSDGLVYKDKSKKGVIRDNITQIIKNLDEPSRRQLANRLETIMPGIKEEVRAINQMPKVIDHYYNPSKLQITIRDKAGGGIGSIFGPLGWFIGNKVGEWTSEKIDEKKIKAWDKVLSETSPEGKAKLAEIESRIENNKKLTQAQQAVINDISERLKDESENMDNTINNITTRIEDIDAGDLGALPLDAIRNKEVGENPTDTVISENVNKTALNQAQNLYNQGDENLSPNSEQMETKKKTTNTKNIKEIATPREGYNMLDGLKQLNKNELVEAVKVMNKTIPTGEIEQTLLEDLGMSKEDVNDILKKGLGIDMEQISEMENNISNNKTLADMDLEELIDYAEGNVMDKYRPKRGEGNTKAEQLATAVSKLVYRYYNDGDMYTDDFAHEVSSYANWIHNNIFELPNAFNKAEYEANLKDILLRTIDIIDDLKNDKKVGSIYNEEGRWDVAEDEDEWQ